MCSSMFFRDPLPKFFTVNSSIILLQVVVFIRVYSKSYILLTLLIGFAAFMKQPMTKPILP